MMSRMLMSRDPLARVIVFILVLTATTIDGLVCIICCTTAMRGWVGWIGGTGFVGRSVGVKMSPGREMRSSDLVHGNTPGFQKWRGQ